MIFSWQTVSKGSVTLDICNLSTGSFSKKKTRPSVRGDSICCSRWTLSHSNGYNLNQSDWISPSAICAKLETALETSLQYLRYRVHPSFSPFLHFTSLLLKGWRALFTCCPYNLSYGHPTYNLNVIKLKWEIIWKGELPSLSGLPHLPLVSSTSM